MYKERIPLADVVSVQVDPDGSDRPNTAIRYHDRSGQIVELRWNPAERDRDGFLAEVRTRNKRAEIRRPPAEVEPPDLPECPLPGCASGRPATLHCDSCQQTYCFFHVEWFSDGDDRASRCHRCLGRA
jgi:hypothetical protein